MSFTKHGFTFVSEVNVQHVLYTTVFVLWCRPILVYLTYFGLYLGLRTNTLLTQCGLSYLTLDKLLPGTANE